MGRQVKAIVVGSIGNLVEWYDFYAYAAFQHRTAHSGPSPTRLLGHD